MALKLRRSLSLRQRVLLWLTLVNVAVFAAGAVSLAWTFREQAREQFVELNEQLVRTLRTLIRDDPGAANVARILDFPGWERIDDAILVSNSFSSGIDGPVPNGLVLNPAGLARRDPALDQRAVFDSLALAAEAGEITRVGGGSTLPLRVDGRVWGACWFQLPPNGSWGALVRTLLPWFLGSTAALVLTSVLLLRGVVLDPLGRLTQAARRMSAGDLTARAEESDRGDEIAELVRTFNGMAERVETFNRELESRVEQATAQAREAEAAAMIQRQLAAMGELAAGIAHEINNPLGGLLNAAGALEREGLAPERRERYLALLKDGLERIRTTVGQVLRIAPRETEPVEVDLGDAVRDAAALIGHRAEEAGVELMLELPPEGTAECIVLGARNELGQVVLNLIVNAIDAQEGGVGAAFEGQRKAVFVTLEPRAKDVVLEVRDRGPGVAPELLPRLRDPFFSTKEVGRGTGLGLSIVERVVDLHGGRLELHAEPGSGFRARLTFPRRSGPQPGVGGGAA